MSEFHDNLWEEFEDGDYRASYADSFVDSWVAMQIRVIREQREMTQTDLADALGTTQTAISRLENVNYSGRSISTLKAVARALDCRLKVSFETYGSLIDEADKMSAESLLRPRFKDECAARTGALSAIGGTREEFRPVEDSSLTGLSQGKVGYPAQPARSSRAIELLQGKDPDNRDRAMAA
jgi:transcriptional regulator with XRE-family HTH domain